MIISTTRNDRTDVNQIGDLKTFAGLCGYLKSNPIHDINILKWRSLYQITVGNHDKNLFISIDMLEKSIRVIERFYNGKNYDLGRQRDFYPTRAGGENLLTLLNEEG